MGIAACIVNPCGPVHVTADDRGVSNALKTTECPVVTHEDDDDNLSVFCTEDPATRGTKAAIEDAIEDARQGRAAGNLVAPCRCPTQIKGRLASIVGDI